jgi:hypothetical protein
VVKISGAATIHLRTLGLELAVSQWCTTQDRLYLSVHQDWRWMGTQSESGQKRRTVLRTIRLGADISEKMEAKAQQSGSSVNSLLSSLVTRYSEWDELAERFGFMDISKEFFRLFLDASDDERLKRVTAERSVAIWSDLLRFWFGEVTPDSFVKMLGRMSTYGWWLEFEPRVNGREYELVIRHDFDMKFSQFLKSCFEHVLKSFFKASPQIDVSTSSLFIRYTIP